MQVWIDGQRGPDLNVGPGAGPWMPLRADLTMLLAAGEHRIELRNGAAQYATASVNASYYVPWTDNRGSTAQVKSGDAESLRYSVTYDHTKAAVGETIRAT